MKTLRLTLPLCLLYLAAVTGLCLAFSALGLAKAHERLLAERRESIRIAFQEFGKKIAPVFFDSGGANVATLNLYHFRELSMSSLSVLDAKGRVLASTKPEENGSVDLNTSVDKIFDAGEPEFYDESVGGAARPPEQGLCYFIPVRKEDKLAGGVKLRFSVADIDAYAAAGRKRLILLWALAAGGGLLVLLALLRGLSAVHGEMEKGVEALAKGNEGFEIPLKPWYWPKTLLSGFNTLSRALKSRAEAREKQREKWKLLAAAPTLDALFSQLSRGLKEEMGAPASMLLTLSHDRLSVTALSGFESGLANVGEEYAAEEEAFREVLDYGKPVFLDDPSEIARNPRYARILRETGPAVLFPLSVGDEVYGLLHVGGSQSKTAYAAQEVEAGALWSGVATVGLKALSGTPAIAKTLLPAKRIFEPLPGISCHAMALGKEPGVFFFDFASAERDKTFLVSVWIHPGANPSKVGEQVAGMVLLFKSLQGKLNSLVFFSLSILKNMPASPKRDQFLAQFEVHPLTVAGLSEALTRAFPELSGKVKFEILKLDLRRKTCEAKLSGLSLFRVIGGETLTPLGESSPWEQGDRLIALPANGSDPRKAGLLNDGLAQAAVLNRIEKVFEDKKEGFPGALVIGPA